MSKKSATLQDEQYAKTPTASLSYTQARRSWFYYQGQCYSVERCTQEIFKAFIVSIVPRMSGQSRHPIDLHIGSYPNDSMLERWYVLQVLLEGRDTGLRLFSSREEAQQAARRPPLARGKK